MYAKVNGIRLFYDVEGMGYAPDGNLMDVRAPCFVLHGGPGLDHSYFKPWLTPLTETMQLIYVDHRGTGRSERAPLETLTIEQMADDLEELRKTLGLDKVIVMGNSFGGMWAMVYALRHPASLAKLILISTTPSHEFYDAATANVETMATPAQQAMMPALFEGKVTTEEEFARWWDVMLALYFKTYDPVAGSNVIARWKTNQEATRHMFAHEIPKYDVRPGLPGIRVPTLITAGRHDWVTPPGESEQIAALIPGSELVVYEESGHFPFIEEQAAWIEKVNGFVRGAS